MTPFVTIARNDFALAQSASGRGGGRGGGRTRSTCRGDFLRLYNPTSSSARDPDDRNSRGSEIDFCGSLSGDKRINLIPRKNNVFFTFSADSRANDRGFRLRVCLP